MTTQLSIDTTIISTIISAAVAILVACVTVTLTLRSNRKLENEKHLKQKKEDVYSVYLDILSVVYDLKQESHNETKVIILAKNKIEKVKNNIMRLTMLSRLYFPALDGVDMMDATTHVNHLMADICEGRNPNEKKYLDAMHFLNKLNSKITSL
ncbi:hypothetical protein ACJ8LH_13050 [Serratia sp. CY49633]|uniref:hypothetical protein n=1 Tax=Serratia TaxID=613 RepID=UPI001008B841|nr:hypothetical protein [Serratia marcescens]ELL0334881.1 hypothetical protein [Serratia marcescens]MBH2550701.1 hypothetical protein [Serratia marcescens]MBH2859126.1 hypothetical protein [Serratia marcescens]MBH2994868.1 hypothetical protein [Serratia marcescens]MBH3091023.1 hypothetical protein [Serratia marcescens]